MIYLFSYKYYGDTIDSHLFYCNDGIYVHRVMTGSYFYAKYNTKTGDMSGLTQINKIQDYKLHTTNIIIIENQNHNQIRESAKKYIEQIIFDNI